MSILKSVIPAHRDCVAIVFFVISNEVRNL